MFDVFKTIGRKDRWYNNCKSYCGKHCDVRLMTYCFLISLVCIIDLFEVGHCIKYPAQNLEQHDWGRIAMLQKITAKYNCSQVVICSVASKVDRVPANGRE